MQSIAFTIVEGAWTGKKINNRGMQQVKGTPQHEWSKCNVVLDETGTNFSTRRYQHREETICESCSRLGVHNHCHAKNTVSVRWDKPRTPLSRSGVDHAGG